MTFSLWVCCTGAKSRGNTELTHPGGMTFSSLPWLCSAADNTTTCFVVLEGDEERRCCLIVASCAIVMMNDDDS